MPDFVNEDDIIILEGERDILFSRERWREIARSVRFHELPHEMKQEIADLLINNLGTSNGQAKVGHRTALKKLVKLLEKLQSKIFNLQCELSSEDILNQMKGLVEHAKIVMITAKTELTSTSKVGRPWQKLPGIRTWRSQSCGTSRKGRAKRHFTAAWALSTSLPPVDRC